jgi:hypothetical protein
MSTTVKQPCVFMDDRGETMKPRFLVFVIESKKTAVVSGDDFIEMMTYFSRFARDYGGDIFLSASGVHDGR